MSLITNLPSLPLWLVIVLFLAANALLLRFSCVLTNCVVWCFGQPEERIAVPEFWRALVIVIVGGFFLSLCAASAEELFYAPTVYWRLLGYAAEVTAGLIAMAWLLQMEQKHPARVSLLASSFYVAAILIIGSGLSALAVNIQA